MRGIRRIAKGEGRWRGRTFDRRVVGSVLNNNDILFVNVLEPFKDL